MMKALLFGGLVLVAWAFALSLGIVIIVGAVKMMRLKSYNWALAASILALLPCNPAGLLGLVMGIWSLVVLNRPQVKAAFGGRVRSAHQPVESRSKGTRLWLIVVLAVCLVLLVPTTLLLVPVLLASWLLFERGDLSPRGYGPDNSAITTEPGPWESRTPEGESAAPADAASADGPRWTEISGIRRPVPPLPGGPAAPPTHVAFSADGETLIAVIGEDLHTWEDRRDSLGLTSLGRRPIGEFIYGTLSGTLSPTGDTITLVRPAEGPVELWDLAGGQRLAEINKGGPADAAFSQATFAPDRTRAALARADGSLALWDVATSSERSTLRTNSPVSSLAFTGDGTLLAGGCADGTVRLWEVASREALTDLEGLSSPVTAVAFTRDGGLLAAGAFHGTIRLWHVDSGEVEATIQGEVGLTSLAFDPSGGYLVAAGDDSSSWRAGVQREFHAVIQRWVRFPFPDQEQPQEPPHVRLLRVGRMEGDFNEPYTGLAIQGTHAYLLKGTSLRVIDISDPRQPFQVGSCPLPADPRSLAVAGERAYVIDAEKLSVIDLSDPAAPRAIGATSLSSYLWEVAVQGNYAYVTDIASLRVVDVSDPITPKEVGRCDVEGAQGLAVAGNYVYLGCDTAGLRVIDVSDPTAPREVGAFEGPGNAVHVTVADNYAYISGGEDAVALWIVDISDPLGPKAVARYGDWISGGAAIAGNSAYVPGGSLEVLDISDPAAPVLVGSYSAPGVQTSGIWDVAVVGDYVYALEQPGFSILRVVRRQSATVGNAVPGVPGP